MKPNGTIAGKYNGARSESDTQENAGTLAVRISEYVRTEAAQGRKVSYAQAAVHVETQIRGQGNSAQSLALRITAYMDEQRALGNRVSYAEALQYVESHPEAPAQRDVKAQNDKMDARSLADRISQYVAEQRALGNRITCAEALQYVESH